MLTDRKIAIIIACYNDAGSVKEMLKRLHAVMATVTPNYEIVYVNDASPDGAHAVLAEEFKHDNRLTVITHSRNFGAQNVFTCGIENTQSDAVVLMDGDLQDPPELIPAFVEKWLAGYQVVYGTRERRKASLLMTLAYKIFYRIYRKLSYVQVPLDAGDFSLMDRQIADILVSMPERDRFLRGLRAWVGFKQIGISYVRPERFSGVSNQSFWDNIRWAKKGIFSLSFKPLEWISYLAFVITGLSALAIFLYIFFYLRYGAPPGFVTQLVVTLFLGSVQLLCFAVIAEYLGRIFEEVKARPRYIVQDISRHEKKDKK
jgi:glycosyltransferase involved in cell wall biosynthesis